jgi:hypothetical protein
MKRSGAPSKELLMFVLSRRRPEVYSAHRAKSQVSGTTKHLTKLTTAGGGYLRTEIEAIAEVKATDCLGKA